MIRVHCRNLVTVSDSYGAPISCIEYGNLVTVNDSWSPILYMECGNLVIVNDSYGPHLPYMEQVSYGHPNMYDMIFSGQLQKRSTACPKKSQNQPISKWTFFFLVPCLWHSCDNAVTVYMSSLTLQTSVNNLLTFGRKVNRKMEQSMIS